MDVVDTTEEAAGLELPPLLVREPLEAFLDEHGIGAGRLEAERIGEGHSNITFLVRRGDARVVLRRPPRPPLPPSAHDVLREARLLRALEGTPVRVPPVLAVGDDESVLGVPFYVMEEVHGSVLASTIPDALDTPEERRRTAEELVDALVEVHAVDWELSTIGDPLADVGYMTVTWIEPDDPDDTMFSSIGAVTRREGFPSRAELIARYEERSGRSMSALN